MLARLYRCNCGREYLAPTQESIGPDGYFPFSCTCGNGGRIHANNVYEKDVSPIEIAPNNADPFPKPKALPFGVCPPTFRDEQPVYRCQSPSCGAYLLRSHLELPRELCPCGSITMKVGEGGDVRADQFRNIATMNAEYKQEHESFLEELKRYEQVNERQEKELDQLRVTLRSKTVECSRAVERAVRYRTVIDKQSKYLETVDASRQGALEVAEALRRAGLPICEQDDSDEYAGFRINDCVRVLSSQFHPELKGSYGTITTFCDEDEARPIGVRFENGQCFGFDAFELIVEDIPF